MQEPGLGPGPELALLQEREQPGLASQLVLEQQALWQRLEPGSVRARQQEWSLQQLEPLGRQVPSQARLRLRLGLQQVPQQLAWHRRRFWCSFHRTGDG